MHNVIVSWGTSSEVLVVLHWHFMLPVAVVKHSEIWWHLFGVLFLDVQHAPDTACAHASILCPDVLLALHHRPFVSLLTLLLLLLGMPPAKGQEHEAHVRLVHLSKVSNWLAAQQLYH